MSWTPTRAASILLLLTAWSLPAQAVDVRQIRLWAGPHTTRVVLDLSGRVRQHLFLLRNPDRVVLDLPAARIRSASRALPAGAGVVRDVRVAQHSASKIRIVLDLRRAAAVRSFLSPPNDRYGYRLVVDLSAPSARVIAPVPVAHEPRPARDLVIAIDPGHGGEDPGAIGIHGTREKDVVLAIGKDLAARVNAQPGMRAYLTRSGDYFVPLRDRMLRARAHDADLFVSIHADSVRDHSVDGSSVYILSQRGASDEAARWLAERENESDLIGGVSLEDKDQVLASVLLDLSQSAAMSASEAAAQRVLRALNAVGQVRKEQVQQARFIVLKSPDVPSMLVETAYISNPREELRLRTPAQQMKIAGAIMTGVRKYFYANPPAGSRIAQLVAARSRATLLADGSGR
ncbi:MAG: N-acetylmuramoyl-L-alanine amidase [Gammaproteobacteria bacterium]|nr:N-acetylmuramoyl-L-alanine amidase [Gammaproteobacteria bacterium]